MPITKAAVKPIAKPAKAASQKGVLSDYVTVVDRLAELEAIISPEVQKALKERKRLEDELRAVADAQVPADEKVVFAGTKANFSVSEKSEQRTVDVKQARLALGEKLFGELARLLLGDVDRYLSKSEQSTCVTAARTGSRKGQLVLK